MPMTPKLFTPFRFKREPARRGPGAIQYGTPETQFSPESHYLIYSEANGAP